MARRQHVPWKAAGSASETQSSADRVVRETGWVFNNVTGSDLSLADFVESGDHETLAYLQAFGQLSSPPPEQPLAETFVEIGSGIGRMTASFTRLYQRVVACDLDAAFLERCRQTVAQFGVAPHLQTCHVADGHTLGMPNDSADVVFSYITLQHCHRDDALGLTREAVRIARPGGRILLNYRTWVPQDALLFPAGVAVRALFRLPTVGPKVAQMRLPTRLGWQANRLAPAEVLAAVGDSLDDICIFRSPKRRPFALPNTIDATFDGIDASHWWLTATVR